MCKDATNLKLGTAILHTSIMQKEIKIKLEDVDSLEDTYIKFKDFLGGFPGSNKLEVANDNVKFCS